MKAVRSLSKLIVGGDFPLDVGRLTSAGRVREGGKGGSIYIYIYICIKLF